MVADVSLMVNNGNLEILGTKDLLGELLKIAVYNDLQVIPLPHLKLKNFNPPMHSLSLPTSMVDAKKHNTYDHHVMMRASQLQNIDFSYSNNFLAHTFLQEICLELKLQGPSTYSPTHLQSLCTLDKVKSTIKRVEKQSYLKKRSSSSPLTSLSDYNQKQEQHEQTQGSEMDGRQTMFAAGCPGCCMCIMALKNNIKCPCCKATIASPSLLAKKPRLDLNATI